MRCIDQTVQWTGFVALIIHLSSFLRALIIIHWTSYKIQRKEIHSGVYSVFFFFLPDVTTFYPIHYLINGADLGGSAGVRSCRESINKSCVLICSFFVKEVRWSEYELRCVLTDQFSIPGTDMAISPQPRDCCWVQPNSYFVGTANKAVGA